MEPQPSKKDLAACDRHDYTNTDIPYGALTRTNATLQDD